MLHEMYRFSNRDYLVVGQDVQGCNREPAFEEKLEFRKGLTYFDFGVRREHRSVEVFVITNAMTRSQRQEKFTPAAECPKLYHHPKGCLHHWCWYLVYYYP